MQAAAIVDLRLCVFYRRHKMFYDYISGVNCTLLKKVIIHALKRTGGCFRLFECVSMVSWTQQDAMQFIWTSFRSIPNAIATHTTVHRGWSPVRPTQRRLRQVDYTAILIRRSVDFN